MKIKRNTTNIPPAFNGMLNERLLYFADSSVLLCIRFLWYNFQPSELNSLTLGKMKEIVMGGVGDPLFSPHDNMNCVRYITSHRSKSYTPIGWTSCKIHNCNYFAQMKRQTVATDYNPSNSWFIHMFHISNVNWFRSVDTARLSWFASRRIRLEQNVSH